MTKRRSRATIIPSRISHYRTLDFSHFSIDLYIRLRMVLLFHLASFQDTANNSTPLRYLSKTRQFGNYSSMNPWKSRPSYLTLVRVKYLYFTRIWRILVESRGTKLFFFQPIFDSVFDSGLSNSTLIHQFYYSASTRLRSPTFRIRLDNESRVVTPLCRYLLLSLSNCTPSFSFSLNCLIT